MSATRTTRLPGLLYWVMGLPAVFSLQYVPSHFYVAGDAAATAQRITGALMTYRVGVVLDLVSNITYLVLALTLYHLLRDVDRRQARLLVAFVTVSVAIGLANEINQLAPLMFLTGSGFKSAFTQPQLDALAMAFVRLRGTGLTIDSALWGLWLFPFGVLVIKSGFIPRIMGFCLIIGGVSYLATCVTNIAFPEYRHVMSLVVLPFYAIGELPIALWLLIKGVRVTEPRPLQPRVA